MSYSQTWLEDQYSNKIVLVECTVYDTVAASEINVFFSNGGYTTADGLTSFTPLAMGNIVVSEKLGREGNVSMSVGDIAINNADGRFDSYLGARYIWVNRPITVYYGDPSWIVADLATLRAGTVFAIIFSGTIADIGSSSKDTINIKLRDKLERLNTPVSDVKIGTYGVWAGGQQNQDQNSPLVFGEVHNITPILVDPSTLEYRFSTGNSERLIEVRDNGVPITAITEDLANGQFRLASPSVGTITCSVQGVKKSINLSTGAVENTYSNNIASLIALICRDYGSNASNRLSASELDLAQLASFAASNTQSVGIFLSNRENVLSVCQSIAASIGAQIYMSRTGKLRLLRFGVPESITSVSITESDIIKDTIKIVERIPVTASTKIGYARNWTVQTGLLTAIPEQHKEMFSEEWYSKTVEDSSVKSLYRLEGDPQQKDTLLLTDTDASTEATRLNNYYKTPKTVYGFTGKARLLSLQLGQPVTLTHTRFGLSSGVSAQVVGLVPNWATQTIEVEVVV